MHQPARLACNGDDKGGRWEGSPVSPLVDTRTPKEVYVVKTLFTNLQLREPIETLLKNVDVNGLKTQAVRLEAVVCKYNEVMRTINDYERRLLERKLYAAEEVKSMAPIYFHVL